MKHNFKYGKTINDNDIKFVKKLMKKNPIRFTGVYWSLNVEIEVKNIRKYKESHRDNKFVYEVDIKVEFKKGSIGRRSVRSMNDRIRRWTNESLLRDELSFFNIQDLVISKIEYVYV